MVPDGLALAVDKAAPSICAEAAAVPKTKAVGNGMEELKVLMGSRWSGDSRLYGGLGQQLAQTRRQIHFLFPCSILAGELDKQAVTIAEVMKSAGYATYMAGKWHLTAKEDAKEATTDADRSGWPCQRGFDRFYGFLGGVTRYFDSDALVSDNAPVAAPVGSYVTDLFAEHACGFIADHAKSQTDKPFFMYLAFNAPHWGVTAKPEDVAAYQGVYDIGWDALREQRLAKQKELGVTPPTCVLSPRNEDVTAWDALKPDQKTEYSLAMSTYAGMITCMDRGIGQVLAALEAAKLRDNTLVIFLSDNGACAEGATSMKKGKGGDHPSGRIGPGWANAGNTPFRYWKNTTWEGGSATELILNWPQGLGKPQQGSITHEVGHVIDLMPTCVELAQATYPKEFKGNTIAPMEGRSLVPTLTGKSIGPREIFWKYQNYDSVRSGDWKMTRKGGDWELFDLGQDPAELNDQAKTHPETVKDLAAKWQAWAERVKALDENGEKKINKKLHLYIELDSDLLGGIYAKIGNILIDGSIKRRLEDMRAKLLAAKVVYGA